MVDIQANIRIEVQNVPAAAQRVRELMKKSGGLITNETSSEESASAPQSNFTLRVPVSRSDARFQSTIRSEPSTKITASCMHSSSLR